MPNTDNGRFTAYRGGGGRGGMQLRLGMRAKLIPV